ncbi:hypothetical protein Pla22_16660 [Rubripirellula amarantea]|uniref:Alpha-galactosidase NEW3 domain-containing protein n=1 Tax=Rubripirellula amarantea TaxID=2527999 RepID=A0A5C5WV94_9BACT|nr:hypothetical protein [Rubripirellula amarantea]TWT54031.1 hypothetical protein Pla22_16660 [Rubripirellula amarantea]
MPAATAFDQPNCSVEDGNRITAMPQRNSAPKRDRHRGRVTGGTIIRWFAVAMLVMIFTRAGGDLRALEPSPSIHALAPVPTKPIAIESLGWRFNRGSDQNYDAWPDQWRRYEGVGYPKYVVAELKSHDEEFDAKMLRIDRSTMKSWKSLRESIKPLSEIDRVLVPPQPLLLSTGLIAMKAARFLPTLPPSLVDALSDQYFRVQLDGGQFKVQSPPIAASRLYQYQLSCDVMTEGLRHDSVRVELVFLNESGIPIDVKSSAAFTGTTPWTTTSLEMVRPPVDAKTMLVRLNIERSEGGLEDIRGAVGFDNVRIDKFPQLRITSDQSTGVYKSGRPITLSANVLGLTTTDTQIQFQLKDVNGNTVDSAILPIKTTTRAVMFDDLRLQGVASNSKAFRDRSHSPLMESSVQWQPRLLDPGFYRVEAIIVAEAVARGSAPRARLGAHTTLAVIDPTLGGTPHGPFGWTLTRGDAGLAPRELAEWLSDVGVAWVKYPCWIGPEDTPKAEAIANTLSRLQDVGIQTVGMLDSPPENQIAKYELRGRNGIVAAELFRDREIWQPELEPIMSRLTLKVRTWQLGGDRDFSFLRRPRLKDTISEISKGLQGFGQPIEVAISWPWLERELPVSETSWDAVCRSSEPPLEANELDAFLALNEPDKRVSDGPRTWLLLDPIKKSEYELTDRIRDLVLRMTAVRTHRVQAAFASTPYDPEQGLLDDNGSPSELLLPWRTTSRMIGDLRQVGSLRTRLGVENAVFVGGNRAVVMMWSSDPKEEKIYFGENVKMVDVWGRATNLPVQSDPVQPHQKISVGRIPVFIVGADPMLLAFRMSVDVTPEQFDALLGKKQQLKVHFTNPTREPLVGSVRVLTPESWAVEDPIRGWEALAGTSLTESFDVVLSNTAKIGEYEVPIQFELDTLPLKLITVYRNISIGPDGLIVKVMTRLMPSGELRVEIEMTNRSAIAQSYNALLFVPGRQYQSSFITIKSGETVRREIFWKNGRELIGGQMTLRASEHDGGRVLNYTVEVKR